MIAAFTQLDFAVLYWIQETFRCAFGDVVIPFISTLGNTGICWIVLGVVLLFPRQTRVCGICVLVCLAVDCVIGEGLLKHIFMRQRPFIQQPVSDLLIAAPTSSSFPSGHSASSFTAATAIYLNHKRAGIAAYVLAALIAFSRLYCFVHFPSDVLAGCALGTVVALVLTPMVKKKAEEKLHRS